MTESVAIRISDAIKEAMRARQTDRLTTLRFVQAAIQQKQVDEQRDLTQDEMIAILQRQVKQRRESIAAFESAGRTEQAAKEQAELLVLQEFLPEMASPEEIEKVVLQAISDVQAKGVTGGAAMGQVMGIVKKSLGSKADMSQVSAMVKQKLI